VPVRSFRSAHRQNGPAKPDEVAKRVDRRDPRAPDAPVRKLAGAPETSTARQETQICAKHSKANAMDDDGIGHQPRTIDSDQRPISSEPR